MSDPAKHRSILTGHVVGHLRRHGVDVAPLVAKFGLIDAEAAAVAIPLTRLHHFLEAAATAAKDPFLGVHVAEELAPGRQGLLEYTWRNAPTARHAMAFAAENSGIFQNAQEMALEEGPVTSRFLRRPPHTTRGLLRHSEEFFVVQALRQLRDLTGAPFVPERAFFTHKRPAGDLDELVRATGTTRLDFDADASGIEIRSELLALPNRKADPILFSILAGYVEQLLGREAPDDAETQEAKRLVESVRRAIAAQLGKREPELRTLAAACRTSPRTLQRRLGDAGTSLKQLVDDVRRDEARAAILGGERSVPAIAEQLGYRDTKSFLRAFKRWTGTSPTRFREALAPQS